MSGKWQAEAYADYQGYMVFGEEFRDKEPLVPLVRETIQNSLDQKREGVDYVTVEFAHSMIQVAQIPGAVDLLRYYTWAQDRAPTQKEQRAISRGRELLNSGMSNQVGLLRVSDYGTKGLAGAQTNAEGLSWRRLVSTMGSGNETADNGGSKGVGKKAPFLASRIRTVGYSTISAQDGYAAHAAVAHLASFRHDNLQYSERVFFCDDNYNLATQHGRPAIEGQFLPFCKRSPDEYGTDVLIFGFECDGDLNHLSDSIRKVALEEFCVAFYEHKLELKLPNGEVITNSNLGGHIARVGDRRVREWLEGVFQLLQHPWVSSPELPYGEDGKAFGAGAFKYKVMRIDGGRSEFLVTRNRGMFVHEFTNLSDMVDYRGVAMICDQDMNDAFKAMENAKHDKFEVTANRFEDKTEYALARAQFAAFESFLRRAADELADDIPESTFVELTDDLSNRFQDDLAGAIAGVGNVKLKSSSVKVEKVYVKRQKYTPKITGKAVPGSLVHGPEHEVVKGQINNPNKTKKQKTNPNPSGDVSPESDNPAQNGFILMPLPPNSTNFYATGASNKGTYHYDVKIPDFADKVGFCFTAQNENSSTSAMKITDVKAVKVQTGEELKETKSPGGMAVYFNDVEEGDELSIDVTFDVDYFCYAEVRYYEKKNS